MKTTVEKVSVVDIDSIPKLRLAYTYTENITTSVGGYEFIIHPEVFNPEVFPSPHQIAACWINLIGEIQPSKLLEIGAGAGYMSILAVLHGAREVTATDISLKALTNMKENIAKYKLENRIRVVLGSVFEPIDKNEKYDVIFWNIPFKSTDKPLEKLDDLQRCILDSEYSQLKSYIQEANQYLNKGGRWFIAYSKSLGNFPLLTKIASDCGWRLVLVNSILHSQSGLANQNAEFDVDIYEFIKVL